MDANEQQRVLRSLPSEENWFRLWLVQMAEALSAEPTIDTIETDTGEFNELLSV